MENHSPLHQINQSTKEIQVPISAVSTSSHSEQRSQARQSRWYCGKTWESRSVPNLKSKAPLQLHWGFLVLRHHQPFMFIAPKNMNTGERLIITIITVFAMTN